MEALSTVMVQRKSGLIGIRTLSIERMLKQIMNASKLSFSQLSVARKCSIKWKQLNQLEGYFNPTDKHYNEFTKQVDMEV